MHRDDRGLRYWSRCQWNDQGLTPSIFLVLETIYSNVFTAEVEKKKWGWMWLWWQTLYLKVQMQHSWTVFNSSPNGQPLLYARGRVCVFVLIKEAQRIYYHARTKQRDITKANSISDDLFPLLPNLSPIFIQTDFICNQNFCIEFSSINR